MGGLHDLDGMAHRAALGDGAGEIPRHQQCRLLPDQGRRLPAGGAGIDAGNRRPASAGKALIVESAGLWMLLAVAVVLLATGLPAYAVLMGVSVLFAVVGLALGGLEWGLLTALPGRIIGLLENDLLQAL